jgi:hypothetical protein
MYREERVVAGSAHRHAQHDANGKVEGSEPKPGPRTGCVIHGIHLMRPEARSVAEKSSIMRLESHYKTGSHLSHDDPEVKPVYP